MDKYRKRINTVDREIMNLLNERMDIARDIGKYKKEHNLDIYVKEREDEILSKLRKEENSVEKEGLQKQLISISRYIQNRENQPIRKIKMPMEEFVIKASFHTFEDISLFLSILEQVGMVRYTIKKDDNEEINGEFIILLEKEIDGNELLSIPTKWSFLYE